MPAPAELPVPTPCRVVLYVLSEEDAADVNQQRRQAARLGKRRDGVQIHAGERAHEGDEYPMVIVRVHGDEPDAHSPVNGQVLLDGNDTLWVRRRGVGEGPGSWHWPARG